MSLPEAGTFAVRAATTYKVTAAGEDWVALRVPGDAAIVPAHIENGERRDGSRWVKVRKADLERYFTVHVTVEWHGEQLGLGRVAGDTAEIHGSSPDVAARLGLEGDQYNGFRGKVPVTELTVVDVRETEIEV